jgi:hypothetical protein
MWIKPGKSRSLTAGVTFIIVMIAGLVMMASFSGPSAPPAPFKIVWVAFALVCAGLSFYSACRADS